MKYLTGNIKQVNDDRKKNNRKQHLQEIGGSVVK